MRLNQVDLNLLKKTPPHSLGAKQKGWLLEGGDYLTYHMRLRELKAQARQRRAGHES